MTIVIGSSTASTTGLSVKSSASAIASSAMRLKNAALTSTGLLYTRPARRRPAGSCGSSHIPLHNVVSSPTYGSDFVSASAIVGSTVL